jgi:hypothetical protein
MYAFIQPFDWEMCVTARFKQFWFDSNVHPLQAPYHGQPILILDVHSINFNLEVHMRPMMIGWEGEVCVPMTNSF